MKLKPTHLKELVKNIVYHKTQNVERANVISEFILLNELMSAETHGVHYFLRSIYPFLDSNKVVLDFEKRKSIVTAQNRSVEGIYFLSQIISIGSKIAHEKGISLISIKNPGKVGALRSFCVDVIAKGQTIFIFKNTAPSISHNGVRLTGTNPICIGIGGTRFIFDMSSSTVATNKLRLLSRKNMTSNTTLGLDKDNKPTSRPDDILNGGDLFPFSHGDYWFKSFFLSLTIELLAATSGGKTGTRVGSGTGNRFYSEEGLLAIIIDIKSSSQFEGIIYEIELMLNDVRKAGIRIPGEYDYSKEVDILEEDYLLLRKFSKLT